MNKRKLTESIKGLPFNPRDRKTFIEEVSKGGENKPATFAIKHSELTKELFDSYVQRIINGELGYFNFDSWENYNNDNLYPIETIAPIGLCENNTHIMIFTNYRIYELYYIGDEQYLYNKSYITNSEVPKEISIRKFRDFTKSFPNAGYPFFIVDDSDDNTGNHFAHFYNSNDIMFCVTSINELIFGYATFKEGGYVRWSIDTTKVLMNVYDNNSINYYFWESQSYLTNSNTCRNKLFIELVKCGAITRYGGPLCNYSNGKITFIIDNNLKCYSIDSNYNFTEVKSIKIENLVSGVVTTEYLPSSIGWEMWENYLMDALHNGVSFLYKSYTVESDNMTYHNIPLCLAVSEMEGKDKFIGILPNGRIEIALDGTNGSKLTYVPNN